MNRKDVRSVVILGVLLWLLWPTEEVTTEITFPESPTGNCYDPETDTYYVGDC